MYNRVWNYYVIGTTHRDVGECSSSSWFGESEKSEHWFAEKARDIFGADKVAEDYMRMYNRQGWNAQGPNTYRVGDHQWENDGHATTVYVPSRSAHSSSTPPPPPPPEDPPPPPPITAPVAHTTSASNISPTQATLNGTVNPEGDDTEYYFEYGKTTAYGSVKPIPSGSAGWGTTALSFSTVATGLEPGATYHYAIVASNEGGTSYGGDMIVATPEPNLNGDRYADLAVCNNNEYTAAVSDGTYLHSTGQWSTWGCSPLSRLGDFNGDGKDDLIVPGANSTWAVGVSNGSSFNGPGTQTWLTGWSTVPVWNGAGDFNGDGKDDYVSCMPDKASVGVALSNGTQLNGAGTWSSWGCSPLTRVEDFNGDGKDDLIVPGANNTWAVALSSGNGFNSPGTQTWLWGITNQPAWDWAG